MTASEEPGTELVSHQLLSCLHSKGKSHRHDRQEQAHHATYPAQAGPGTATSRGHRTSSGQKEAGVQGLRMLRYSQSLGVNDGGPTLKATVLPASQG